MAAAYGRALVAANAARVGQTRAEERRFLAAITALCAGESYFHNGENVFPLVLAQVAAAAAADVRQRVLGHLRLTLVDAFAYAVPTAAALRAIAALSPIVELGCGGGFWACSLAELGADVRAYDVAHPLAGDARARHRVPHHRIQVGDPATALPRERDARTLLLCWPPGVLGRDGRRPPGPACFSTMGEDALERFAGEHLVFVGEFSDSFGTPRFFALLEQQFALGERHALPNLGKWQDAVYLYRRR